jgi:toxin FitB
MDAVLRDTDVFSFLSKPRDSRGKLYRPYVKGKTIALSFISVGELSVWTIRRNWSPSRIAALERHLQNVVVASRPGTLQGIWTGKGQLASGQSRRGKRSLDRHERHPAFHSAAHPQPQTLRWDSAIEDC